MSKTILIKTISTFTNYYAVRVDDNVSATDVYHDFIDPDELEWVDSKYMGQKFETSRIAKNDEEVIAFIDEAMPYIKHAWSDAEKLDRVENLTEKDGMNE